MDADYVVVGAGSAGCVVAARLSETGASVILLEAGPKDSLLWIHIPAGILILLCHFPTHQLPPLPQAARTPGQCLDQPDGKLPMNGRDRVRHMPLRPHRQIPVAGSLRVAQVLRSACG